MKTWAEVARNIRGAAYDPKRETTQRQFATECRLSYQQAGRVLNDMVAAKAATKRSLNIGGRRTNVYALSAKG